MQFVGEIVEAHLASGRLECVQFGAQFIDVAVIGATVIVELCRIGNVFSSYIPDCVL